ncbi:MAG TPA: hypothetical protein PLU37_12720 [Chitinophagaceae bacterium]|nr:hypothetical protein [Chitinophagaceae bacterium]MCB9054463.1 hypothetical protein [Chitinophagales bacterium]HPG12388.1 hypothetical protein [Chitinophagaceae bacterium]
MINLENPVIITFGGIILVTILNIAGAILSRKLNFNYAAFGIFSMLIYIGVAYLAATFSGKSSALISVVALGIYDAIAGWELTKKFKANFGMYAEQMENMSVHARVIGNIIFSVILGFIGYWLS